MASNLLNCSICPKRPNFSDTSHLLTHVSSKGHLSHLHKLQVRSHQEIAAGHQLAAYNQWYQQHGLGQLLSERMLQKESKSANKRVSSGNTQAQIKSEIPPSFNKTKLAPDCYTEALPTGHGVKRAARSRRRNRHHRIPDDDSDYEITPVRRSRQVIIVRLKLYTKKASSRRRKTQATTSSPLKRLPSEDVLHASDADCPADDDPQYPATPDNSKLKGVIWPGMDLFDAATAEMKRRRNQKKDGSMLKQMEKTSAIVEPTEVIFSPGGTMRKQRHIDGMVDDSSPLRGETPIPKQQVRRRRPPLAKTSANVPRISRYAAKSDQILVARDFRDRSRTSMQTLSNIPSSSTGGSYDVSSRFSPTEDENMEFKLTVGNLTNRKKGGSFTIFNDCDAGFTQSLAGPPENPQTPFTSLGNQPYSLPTRPQLSFTTTPWLQPQHQQPMQYNSSHLSYPQGHSIYRTYRELASGKENVPSMSSHPCADHDSAAPNPLGWAYPAPGTSNPVYSQMNSTHSGHIYFGRSLAPSDDPFGYSKNPLCVALDQLDIPPDPSPRNVKEGAISPDGTISGHEGNDYAQVFFTSE